MTTATASARTVVQSTPAEKRAMAAKARQLGIPLSELMRRGAAEYRARSDAEGLGVLADAAKAAAERSAAAIDAALTAIAASNRRISAMEQKHAARRGARGNGAKRAA
jgi:hypothetical protein